MRKLALGKELSIGSVAWLRTLSTGSMGVEVFVSAWKAGRRPRLRP
jgi:hypothetical protein